MAIVAKIAHGIGVESHSKTSVSSGWPGLKGRCKALMIRSLVVEGTSEAFQWAA